MNYTLIFRVNSLWNDLQLKAYFSLAFYAEKAEKSQITFFGYKKWLKVEYDDIFRSTTQNLSIFHFYFPLKLGFSYIQ